MYWRFNLITTNIDNILDKGDDVTLQELLEEDDVLQECKAQNKKLLDFFVKDGIIEELVTLTLQEPSEDLEEKVRFKYPNIACELLTSDVTVITEKLAGDEALLNKIYSFMEAEGPLNPLQASFFSKVMGLLITRKSEQMVDFLRGKEGFVTNLLKHIGTSAIMDLLLRLITCVEGQETRTLCVNWLNEQRIVQLLVGLIDPSETEEKNCNAAQSLCDIIRLTREQMSQLQEKADEDPLLTTIESFEVVEDLVHHMFNNDVKNESVLVSGLQVLQALLEFRKPATMTIFGPEGVQELTPLDTERLDKGVKNTVRALCPALQKFHNLLHEPPKQFYSSMSTTAGVLTPPLGSTRLQIIKLITTLILTNHSEVNEELTRLGTIKFILDLNFKYLWNNFLHTQIEQLLSAILSTPPTESEEGTNTSPVLLQLFRECNVVEKLLDLWEENEEAQNRPKGCRRGYMGHLTHYFNLICEKLQIENDKIDATNSDVVRQLFKESSEELQQRWETFTSGALAETNKQNTLDLVASNTFHSSSDSEDPDFASLTFPQDSTMQQAFSDYQLQQMTSTFVEQFGFNEDEFTDQQEPVDAPFNSKITCSIDFDIGSTDSVEAQALFEQACNQRMHQFDDADSDEDLFEEKEITFNKPQSGASGPSQPQRPVQTRTRKDSHHDSDDEEDDEDDEERSESSDSEDELVSPRRIYQTPTPGTAAETNPPESMEVDSSDSWANGEDANMADPAPPVAMDTNPWDSNVSSSDQQAGENWANFGQGAATVSEADSSSKQNSELGFLNFANFDNMQTNDSDTDDLEELDRPASPIPTAMDTNEGASTNTRMAQYMLNNENETKETADTDMQVSSTSDENNAQSPPSTPREAWATPTPPKTPPTGTQTSSEAASMVQTNSSPESSQNSENTAALSNHMDSDPASTSVSSGQQNALDNELGQGDEAGAMLSQGLKSGVVEVPCTTSTSKGQAAEEVNKNLYPADESSEANVDPKREETGLSNTTNESSTSDQAAVTQSPNGPV